MDCERCQDLILLDAIGHLDDPERQEVRAHLAGGCAACAAAFAEAREAMASLALAAKPHEPRPEVRERLMARAWADAATRLDPAPAPLTSRADPSGGATSGGEARGREGQAVPTLAPPGGEARASANVAHPPSSLPPPRPAPARRAWRDWARAGVAASVAAVLAAGITYRAVSRWAGRQLDDVRDDLDALRGQVARLQAAERRSTRTVETIEWLQSPALQVVQLDGAAQPGAVAKLFWDRAHSRWHLRAVGLKPAAAGKVYELWAIDPEGHKAPAGTFAVDASGEGVLDGAAPDVTVLAAAAVTDEPDGGVTQPTGSIQLLGKPAAEPVAHPRS